MTSHETVGGLIFFQTISATFEDYVLQNMKNDRKSSFLDTWTIWKIKEIFNWT